MRLFGLLVTVAVLGYVASTYLGSSPVTSSADGGKSTPAQYTDQAKKSVEAMNDALKKQQQQLEDAK